MSQEILTKHKNKVKVSKSNIGGYGFITITDVKLKPGIEVEYDITIRKYERKEN